MFYHEFMYIIRTRDKTQHSADGRTRPSATRNLCILSGLPSATSIESYKGQTTVVLPQALKQVFLDFVIHYLLLLGIFCIILMHLDAIRILKRYLNLGL